MYLLAAWAFVLLALACLLSRSSRIQESTMATILKCEWYWIVRHTWVQTDSGTILINEHIDAAYAASMVEAVEYAQGRHPVKTNMVLTAYRCGNASQRLSAKQLNDMVSQRIAEFDTEMEHLTQRMH